MADRQRKGLGYNCDETSICGHCCKQKNLFHIDVSTHPEMEEVGPEEPSVEDIDEQPVPILDKVKLSTSTEEAIISLHALSSVSTPQTLKIKGYIKYHQLVVLIDNDHHISLHPH
jgi:hypothetical protein